MREQERDIVIPQRPDGTFKSWWYDPQYPSHIMHRSPCGHVRVVCVGHDHG